MTSQILGLLFGNQKEKKLLVWSSALSILFYGKRNILGTQLLQLVSGLIKKTVDINEHTKEIIDLDT